MKKLRLTAIDTETINGKAFLLSCPNGVYRIRNFSDFLQAMQNIGGRRFCFYNIDYDVTALIKHLGKSIAERLQIEKWVVWQGMRMRYLKGKHFQIITPKGGLYFYDLLPFFQTRLELAAREYLGKHKKDLPKDFFKRMTVKKYLRHQKMFDRYAIQDAKLLQELADLICSALEEIGLQLTHLYSPGYVAKRYLRKIGVSFKDVPLEFQKFVDEGYFGARIEVVKRGFFPTVRIYDIKSAYPYSLSNLPDFSEGFFYLDKEIKEKYFFLRARVWLKPSYIHPLPYRTKENLLIFPQFNGQETTMTSIEYDYLIANKLARKIEIIEVLNICVEDTKPFAKPIMEMYEKRKESLLKKIIFKLSLNSIYGITAQTIDEYVNANFVQTYKTVLQWKRGLYFRLEYEQAKRKCEFAARYWERECKCRHCSLLRELRRVKAIDKEPGIFYHEQKFYKHIEKRGTYRNLALAAFITASTRMRIFDLARRAGDDFIACFTDCVVVHGKTEYDTGGNLGDLEKDYEGKFYLIGSGVYQRDDKTKIRGFKWKRKITPLIRKKPRSRIYRIPQKSRISLRQTLRRPLLDFENVNVIMTDEKRLDINFDSKRDWEKPFKNGGEILVKSMDSRAIMLDNC